jgi:hypothetical protein
LAPQQQRALKASGYTVYASYAGNDVAAEFKAGIPVYK